MEGLLQKYKDKRPAIIFEWYDNETGAEGWVVINNLRNGAAGGGTRMRKGLTRDEVESLAKVMEIKFTVSGPAIGGAKSGINFDPNDPRKQEVLKKWYKAVIPLLKNYYGTGGDLNVDEIRDVIPITEAYGLWHPQEGVVNGHLDPKENEKIMLIGQLRLGVSKKLEDPQFSPDVNEHYTVADMITGWGVAEAARHYYDIHHNMDIQEKRVIIQGWGNVAAAAGYYLAQNGAKIVGIIDREGGVINENGFSLAEVRSLYKNRNGNQLSSEKLIPFDEINQRIWQMPAEIFIPGAASKLVTLDQANSLIYNGLEVISSGANVPFKDEDIFFGEVAEYVDSQVSLIPDFIANCGMARVFAYLMQPDVEVSDAAIFNDVSNIIRKALIRTKEHNPSTKYIAKSSLEIALKELLT